MINIGDISKFTKIRFLYFSRGRLLTRVLTQLRLHFVSKRAFHNSVVSHRHKLRIESCRFREKLGDKEEIGEIRWNDRTKDEWLESGGKRFE